MLKSRNIVLGYVISFFAAVNFYSIAGFYPTYLRTVQNYDVVFSTTLTSIQMCSMLIMAPVILYLSDKYGRKPFLYYSSLLLAPVLYFMFRLEANTPYLVLLLSILYGAVNSGGYPLIVSYFQDSVPEPMVPFATSLCATVFNLGSLLSGPAMGYFVSLIGWENVGIWLLFCCLTYFLAAFIAK
ncbi:MAG: MFS transporter [Candidatus Bathyarchaeia archaeon]